MHTFNFLVVKLIDLQFKGFMYSIVASLITTITRERESANHYWVLTLVPTLEPIMFTSLNAWTDKCFVVVVDHIVKDSS